MKKIVFLPLDERPCNFSFAARMSEGNGEFTLVVPPRSALGSKKTPSDHGEIERFLESSCKEAYALVLSFDQLLYGGIVPSRLHHLDEEEILRRVGFVQKLKRENENLHIYAYALVMRCPRYSSDDEEPNYYATCGKEIFLSGQLEHRRRRGLIGEEEYASRMKELQSAMGENLSDYLSRRKKNLSALLPIARLQKGVLDVLVIPQDDSAPLGYTALDRETLFSAIEKEHLPRPLNYPGADEVGSVLLARAVNEMKGTYPTVEVHYAEEAGKKLVPLYEDRPLEESVLSQIEAAGCKLSEHGEISLFINVTGEEMTDVGVKGEKDREALAPFIEKIAEAVSLKKLAAVADVAYCNGGDRAFVKGLSEQISLFDLASYAGWNTSSNTLGTAIAQAVMCLHYGFSAQHDTFLADRFYEDVSYCARVRKLVCETYLPALGLNYFHADGEEGKAAQIVKKELEADLCSLLPEVGTNYSLAEVRLPWSRMFEAEIRTEKKENKA